MPVGFLAGSGTEPYRTASQKPDHWRVTRSGCQHLSQPLDLPNIILLPISLSDLRGSGVSPFGSISDSLSITMMMNYLLQTTILVLRTQGNEAA